MPALTAVAFDLDDTLYLERDFVRSGYRAVADWAEDRLGIAAPLVLAELEALFAAGIRREVFDLWLEERGLERSLWLARMVEAYRGHAPRVKLCADAEPLFATLRSHGIRLGMITEGVRGVQENKLRALGLEGAFEAVIIGSQEDRDRWKPSRAPFDEWLGHMKVRGDEACYVGDNPAKDFRGAKEAGMRTLRVRRAEGLHAREEPGSPADAPDTEVRDLHEAGAVLLRSLD
jgi:putative hydrolase of the HAD superfamily